MPTISWIKPSGCLVLGSTVSIAFPCSRGGRFTPAWSFHWASTNGISGGRAGRPIKFLLPSSMFLKRGPAFLHDHELPSVVGWPSSLASELPRERKRKRAQNVTQVRLDSDGTVAPDRFCHFGAPTSGGGAAAERHRRPGQGRLPFELRKAGGVAQPGLTRWSLSPGDWS